MNIAAMPMTAVANAVMATISAPNISINEGDRHV
jgi:hypothetical protein